jgi:hypothetical protein
MEKTSVKFPDLDQFVFIPVFAFQNKMFVFSFFREFAPALHLAISEDGLKWKELNGQEPILESQVGVKYWRDPFIIQDQQGVFHLLCTDGWSSPSIVHASSPDLLTWSDQDLLPVMQAFSTAKNAWAPECCYDYEKNEYLIFWSSTVDAAFPEHLNKPKDYMNHRIYACTTKDFKTYSPTFLYFDPGYNVIDASITSKPNPTNNRWIYAMAFKDERGNNTYFPEELARKFVLFAQSESPRGTWNVNPVPISKNTYKPPTENQKETWAEGPCIIWNVHSKEWWVYYEYFRNHQYGLVTSADGNHWINRDNELSFPEGAKHGTIIEVTNPIVISKLKAAYKPYDDEN